MIKEYSKYQYYLFYKLPKYLLDTEYRASSKEE